ncbi:MAG: hypothetical protein ACLQPD_29530 [Desulfomonilaceae bacterium]
MTSNEKQIRIAVSPNFYADALDKHPDKWSTDIKIKIFEDRVTGWQLSIADTVMNTDWSKEKNDFHHLQHAGYAVLHIVFSYFEMLGKYMDDYVEDLDPDQEEDQKTAYYHFEKGVRYVFDERKWEGVEKFCRIGWPDGRCALYHRMHAGYSFFIEDRDKVLEGESPDIVVNPHILAKGLLENFKNYVSLIKDPQSGEQEKLKDSFLYRFNREIQDKVRDRIKKELCRINQN